MCVSQAASMIASWERTAYAQTGAGDASPTLSRQTAIRRAQLGMRTMIRVREGYAASAPAPKTNQGGPSWLEERLGVANRNTEIRTAKPPDDREGHSNHFPIAIDQRSAGASGSGLRVVNNLVGEDIADVALRNQGADQFAALQFINDFLGVSSSGLHDIVDGFFSSARENGAEPRGVAQRQQRLTADRRLFPRINFQDRPLQAGKIRFHKLEIRLI